MGCSNGNNVIVVDDKKRTKKIKIIPENNTDSEIQIKDDIDQLENHSKKIIYQNIFPDNKDYIYDKIKDYELKNLKDIFYDKFYSKNIDEIYNEKKYLKLKLDKNELNNIISNDKSISLLKEIIIEYIEKIKKNDEMYKIKNLTILIVGRKGVGKTALIEYILNYNCSFENNTKNFQVFKNKNYPYLRLIEFKGIGFERKKNNPETIKKEVINYIKSQEDNNDYNNIIHCIWYCISGTRFEESEIILLKKLKEVYNDNNIPIIVIYTKAVDIIMANTMLEYIKNLNIGISTIKLMAKEDLDPEGKTINPFGKDNLLNLTLKKCTEAFQGKMIYLITNSISIDIKRKIIEKNSSHKIEIFHKIQNDSIKKYDKILNDNKFQDYLKNILKMDIFYLFDAYNDQNKIKKLKYTLDLLHQSNMFSSATYSYEKFYKINLKDSIKDTIKECAKNFLLNQAKTEIKNGNVNIINKRALIDIEKSNDYFFKKNFYFILQKIIIKNFIIDNDNIYYNFFQKIVEDNINNLLTTNNSVKNNLSNCFLTKLEKFCLDKKIKIEIIPFENQDNYLPNQYGIENINFLDYFLDNKLSDDSEPFIFTADKSDEKDLYSLLKEEEEKNINMNFNQYLNTNLNDSLNNKDLLNKFMEKIKHYQGQTELFFESQDDPIYCELMELIKKNIINYFYSNLDNLIIAIKKIFFYKPEFLKSNKTKKSKKLKRKQSMHELESFPLSGLSIENKKDLSPINDELKNIILKEKKDFFINKVIKNKIEKIKLGENYLINHVTVIVIGKSGVGKSTLLNAIFKEPKAKTGAPEIQTKETQIYEPTEKNPFFQIIDTRGIELNKRYGPEKIIEDTLNFIKKHKKNQNDFNNLVHCIWYCLTGSSIENKEIQIINKLINEFKGKIPLIIVYTRMISQSNFNNIKETINQKIKNVNLIPVLAEKVIKTNENEDYYIYNDSNIIKSFGLEELKYKTLELVKNSKRNIFKKIKKNISFNIKKEIKEESNIFEEETINLIIEKFVNNFSQTKNEKEFYDYIIELLETNFRIKNSKQNKMSNESKIALNKMTIIFDEITSCIEFSKLYVKEKIDSILEKKTITFLDAQAIIEKINNHNIPIELKIDNKKLEKIIDNFLTKNFYFVSQKFIIYYSIFLIFIPFAKEINKFTNEIIDYLNTNECKEFYESLYKKKFADFEEKIKINK